MVGFSWQTGSSAWGLRSFYEGILGLTRTYDGLKVTPCLPKEWDEIRAVRHYRGSELHLHYMRGNGDGTMLYVDGKTMDGNVICPFGDHAIHEIKIIY